LGIQNKVCGLLNVNGYYDSLIAMVDRAVTEGFIREPHREWVLSDTDVSRLLDRLNRKMALS
jgi:predicted Rossmann-fold nucleotide-binding protein